MVRAAAVLDTQRGMEFIRVLSLPHGSHVHHHQLLHIRRDADRGSVPHLFIVADEKGCPPGWSETGLGNRLGGCHHGSHTGLVVQMA